MFVSFSGEGFVGVNRCGVEVGQEHMTRDGTKCLCHCGALDPPISAEMLDELVAQCTCRCIARSGRHHVSMRVASARYAPQPAPPPASNNQIRSAKPTPRQEPRRRKCSSNGNTSASPHSYPRCIIGESRRCNTLRKAADHVNDERSKFITNQRERQAPKSCEAAAWPADGTCHQRSTAAKLPRLIPKVGEESNEL
jgi:hypothetical protein